MLRLNLESKELYDEEKNQFYYSELRVVELEHSLSSISKWEAKYHKPFFSKGDKTDEETFNYLKYMIISDDDPNVVYRFSKSDILQISEYINDSATATWFSDYQQKRPNRQIITAEIIYYWMFSLNIPIDCEDWHISKLLTLIRVINEKNAKPRKMSKQEIMRRNDALNEQRKARLHSTG